MKNIKLNAKLIAPCGMNCGICKGYLREKNKCPGCREMSKNKPEYCRKCIIMHCEILKKNNMKFCSDKCKKFPCTRLKNLDKRYKNKYHMSMLENLLNIKKNGIRKFVDNEQKRWKCPKCEGIVTCHGGICFSCDYVKFKN
jgi:hypothetical protein